LIRLFGDATGIPPHAYLRQVRVKRAKALLARGDSIANVAQATGFNDQSHLNRWFKRLLGITPGQYRNSVQYS
jgi:AraC-like DNA-binding protein